VRPNRTRRWADQPSRAEQSGIAKQQAVEFRADGKKEKIAWLFELYFSERRNRTVLLIKPTNGSHRIKKESQIMASGCQTGNFRRLHRNFEALTAIGDIVCACPESA
jgi:hypothetical protein